MKPLNTNSLAPLMAIVFCLFGTGSIQAHLTYSGRDFGTFSGLTNSSKTITNQAVTGNYGWADAADGILGDSHRARAFRFHLENPAFVTLTVVANPRATTNSIDGLTPAFSVYAGLGAVAPFPATQTTNPPGADHDFGEASTAWRTWWVRENLDPTATDASATDGSWNARGDWKIGGDGDVPGQFDQLSSFIYKASAAATSGARSVTGSFALPAGDYSVLISGNDLSNKTSGTALSPHGIAATLTVDPTPMLSIVPKVFVAYPTGSATNWVLQAASAVDSEVWQNVTATPVLADGQAGVLLDSGASSQFFRFSRQP